MRERGNERYWIKRGRGCDRYGEGENAREG